MGHRNFTALIKDLKFKIVSEVLFSASRAVQKATFYFIACASFYTVECGFGWVTYWLSKVRHSLDFVKRAGLPLLLSTLQPDTQKLAIFHHAQATN